MRIDRVPRRVERNNKQILAMIVKVLTKLRVRPRFGHRASYTVQIPLGCGQFALFNGHTISAPTSKSVVSWRSVMLLDAGQVLKRPVVCRHCQDERLFTLRAIAENPQLRCP